MSKLKAKYENLLSMIAASPWSHNVLINLRYVRDESEDDLEYQQVLSDLIDNLEDEVTEIELLRRVKKDEIVN